MEYIRITKENLESEHICCAIAGNKDPQVLAKKAWMKDRMDEGLVFYTYVPAFYCKCRTAAF